VDARRALLRRKMASLKASPDDADLFKEVHDLIELVAKDLPPAKRSRIQGIIDAALRVGDVEGLERGLGELSKGEAPAP
jgi:hypothetical protein